MSVTLPTSPAPNQADISYLDWGGVIRSPLGGADQKLNRLGDRFALAVSLPVMESFGAARAWIAALVLAQKTGAVCRFPQPGFEIGAPGAPVVDGAGQAGMTLAVRGGAAGYVYRAGQMLSLVHGGRRYLHMVTADIVASGAGAAALPVAPMLRAPYANGVAVEVAVPMIEGFLDGNSREWTIDLAMTVGLSFRVVEAE